MPQINKPELRALYAQVLRESETSPDPDSGAKLLDRLVAIVGDRRTLGVTTTSSAAISKQITAGNLSLSQKLALAKAGLDSKEKADINALLSDASFTKLLDPVVTNFLRALVGIEPLNGVDAMDDGAVRAADAARPPVPPAQAAAVRKMRDLVDSGRLEQYYLAATGAVDDPNLRAEALELFESLPVVNRHTTAADFVRMGFWSKAPTGIEPMQRSARYLPGRQVLVETTVNVSDVGPALKDYSKSSKNDVSAYDPNGVKAVTYRAILIGEDPKSPANFLVDVDSAAGKPPSRISVPKKDIFRLNQPHELSSRYVDGPDKQQMPYNGTSWAMDYASPWAKAKLAEIAIKLDRHVAKLDFTKAVTESSGSMVAVLSRASSEKMADVQQKCVDTVFNAIDMWYPKDSSPKNPGRCDDREQDIGRQAIRGTGMCVQQTTVMGGLLMPFAQSLGIDMQFKVGNVYRFIKPDSKDPFHDAAHGGHGWWQLTLRPSMKMVVCDRTWNQPHLPLDRAYGFPNGDRYPREDNWGYGPIATTATDVNMDVSVETFERQFAQHGDGRENHIANRQPRGRG